MKHSGDLEITKNNAAQYKDLTEVDGWVYVYDGKFAANKLEKISGWLTIHAGATMEAPVLQRVDGWLYVYGGATLTAPALSEVTEGRSIREGAILDTPSLPPIP